MRRLEIYASTRAYLSELGLKPGRALKALQHDILAQAPWLQHERPAAGERASSAGEALRPSRCLRSWSRALETPFVGRAADLDALAGVYAQAVADDRRLVLVCGEPGIGKTRLATRDAIRAARARRWRDCALRAL
jgi:hypothetical protein